MLKSFKGEVVYNQEVDKHFPHLTVWETLSFAAAARTPSRRVKDISRADYINHMTQVMMNIFGLSHTKDTKVKTLDLRKSTPTKLMIKIGWK